MPPQPGEVSLLTLFADVHYFISPPTTKPPHHRFDKGSYVYLYHSPMSQKGRIEIANHAGTPDQDAFAGKHTYKHPCLFTITIDAFRGQGGSAGPSPQQDPSHWHLPTPDPQNNGKYMYRLHTIDIYFWTPDDATLFLDSLKRVSQPHQLHVTPHPSTPPHSEHKSDVLNPVVAKLEKAAISHTSRSPSISTTQSFPGPPTAPAPTASPPAGDYTPMAYNPAAPAAPEPIAHREKTPPPPDAADGTGLGAAAINDHRAQQYGSPLQNSFAPQSTSSQPYMPGPPSRTSTFSGSPAQGVQRTNTAGSGSLPPPPPQSPPAHSYNQSFAPPPSAPPSGQLDLNSPPQPGIQRHSTLPTPQYANFPHSPGLPQNYPGSPGHPVPSPGYAPQPYNPMASPGHPPPGGFAQYQYGSTNQQTLGTDSYAVQQQLYRPTEQEAGVHGNEPAPPQRNSNIGKRADKIEKGVGKFLKKLDKKF
ncbi:hypothetical protein CC78DRAFT_563675 [Lojkania enalia]|uniref:RNA recognition motif-containing protein n=1 Tax=Lojkania enalia TaxID=147567 RepID=A0A9P4NDH6_9PLEO|nr:hypothetical protein CC78DRAFT_563675 [Didymosphaeria enalia]